MRFFEGVVRQNGDMGGLWEGSHWGGKDNFGGRKRRREAGLHDLSEGREKGGGKGEDFRLGGDELDVESVVLGSNDNGRGVEDGGREEDAEGVVCEGRGKDGFQAGEEELGELGGGLGEVGGRGEDGGRLKRSGIRRRGGDGGLLRDVVWQFGDGGWRGEGEVGRGEDYLGTRGLRREAGLHDLGEGRKEGGGEGDGFRIGGDELDEERVVLGGNDNGRGVEEGGREGDAEFVVFEGGGRDGSQSREEEVGELGRFFGEGGGEREDGEGGGLTRRRGGAEGGGGE